MSAYVEVTPELMAGFLDEAPEYLSMLDDGLMAFEAQAGDHGISLEDPADQERMNEMFRAAHSLKGLAATMGFHKIRDLTHLMETLFDQVKMGKRVLYAEAIETLFGVFDKLRALVDELTHPPDAPATIDAELETLQRILDAPSGQDSAKTPKTSGSSVAAPHGSVFDLSNELAADPEMFQCFVETTLETIEELNQQLLKLEKAPADRDILNEIFRCAHNIKGASGAVGCTTMHRLTHDMETVLDSLRENKLELDDSLLATLFRAVDRLQGDADLIKEGRADELSSEGISGVFTDWLGETTMTQQQESGPPPTLPEFESDDGVVIVQVRFSSAGDDGAIQAFLIHRKLADCGEVLRVVPDLDTLDPDVQIQEVTYWLRTTIDPKSIETVVRTFAVSEVTARRPECDAPSPATTSTPADRATASPGGPPSCASPPSERPGVGSAKTRTVPAKPTSGQQAAPLKTQETIRVDLERLDQLMNLGGELVITKARLVQIQSQLAAAFARKNLTSLAEDLAGRIERLRDGLDTFRSGRHDRQIVADMSDDLLHLADDFETIKALVFQVRGSHEVMSDFAEAIHSLSRVSDGIQKRVMQTRMVAIGPLFQRFRRVIRDISKSTDKRVELVLHGEMTELDKRMVDELGDPLTHMVRNSVDHGIEPPAERVKAGKSETGRVELKAFHRGRHICIEVRDDGRGLDVNAIKKKIVERELATSAQVEQMNNKEIMQYVFRAGFSTAVQVSDLSGRGMGMDIVTRKIEALNGTVQLDSVPGKGTTVTINLPLTLAIIQALVVRIGGCVYAIPLEAVAEIITVSKQSFHYVGRKRIIQVREHLVPVAMFEEIFDTGVAALQTRTRDNDEVTLVVLRAQDDTLGLVVDEMIGQEDVVIKSLAANYRNVSGVAGASITGDGSVSLILDATALMSMFAERCSRIDAEPSSSPAALPVPVEAV
ncbi:MAG: chemotaxis protein CheA [Planctomycetes bacterium]|nr:chemotaxis protein CheA [Planctomycetota bacterium]